MARRREDFKPKTLKAYETDVRSMQRQCIRERGVGMHDSPDEFADWFAQRSPALKKSTFNRYKSALLAVAEVYGLRHLEGLIREIDSTGTQRGRRKACDRKTSEKRAKSINIKDLQKLFPPFIDGTISGFNYWKQLSIRAGFAIFHTGMRPIELATAEVVEEEGRLSIKVTNAKHDDVRAHGKFRHIPLSQPPAAVVEEICKVVKACSPARGAKGQAISREYFSDHICDTFSSYSRSVFPGRQSWPTEYTFRHQFMADMKASKMSRLELAALVGHACDKTASIHYAGRKSGRTRGHIPSAKSEEVARVRKVYRKGDPTKWKKEENRVAQRPESKLKMPSKQ